MKISGVTTWIVYVPFKQPLRWSFGVHYGTTRTIVEVKTDEGITGIGEAPGSVAKSIIDNSLGPILKGDNTANIQLLVEKCKAASPVIGLNTAPSAATTAIEVACWDIFGKELGRPIHSLLGGKLRGTIKHIGYVFPIKKGDINSDAAAALSTLPAYCKDLVEHYGFDTIELKVGVFPPDVEVDIVAGIRQVLGEKIDIRIDSNKMWSLETAIPTIKAMNAYKLSNVEEPVASLESMANIRPLVGTHFSTHCMDVNRVVMTGAADAIVGDLHDQGAFGGGIVASRNIIAATRGSGLDYWFHSSNELGISATAVAHVASSMAGLVNPHQSMHCHLTDDIIKDWQSVFAYHKGAIRVPDGIGLGVELDMQKIDKYTRLYDEGVQQNGQTDRYFGDIHEPNWSPVEY